MEDLLQYFDFSEVDSVTAKLAGTDTVSFSDLFGLFIKGDFTGAYKLLMQELGQLFFPGITAGDSGNWNGSNVAALPGRVCKK